VRSADLILLHAISQLHVEGLPADLPETIAVDVTDLTEVDQAIHVRDLAVPANVTVLDDPDELVVKVQQTRAAVEPEAPSEAAEESAQGAAQGDKSDA
jgi:large subunit ribosomal protein L25